jgi:ubiquinone/menaquinone biosynthesis C-methylase UbiE
MIFADDSFDCVIASDVFEHVPDLDRLLAEVYRVLKPGGVLFFTTPFLGPYHEVPRAVQRWTAFGAARRLALTAFRQADVASVGTCPSTLAQVSHF